MQTSERPNVRGSRLVSSADEETNSIAEQISFEPVLAQARTR